MDLGVSVRFRILEDHSNSTIALARQLERPGEIWYSSVGMQDVTVWFEDAMLEPLLALLESGAGIVRSSTSELAFEARLHPNGIALHASGDDPGEDPGNMVLTRDEAREIARTTRIVFGVRLDSSAEDGHGD